MNIQICSKADLLKLGIPLQTVISRIVEIDGNNDLNEETQGNEERLLKVFNATEDMWRVLMANNKIVGYWNCVALNEEYQKKVENGSLHEADININNLNPNLKSGVTTLLFDSVCIDKPYQKMRLLDLVMLKSVYETLHKLPLLGVKVDKIWGSVWAEDAETIFKKLGFVFVKNNYPRGKLYYIAYDTFIKKLESLLKRFRLFLK